ncbi:MAG: rRNA maturation RNase YbeY [Bacteroidales bacterium]
MINFFKHKIKGGIGRKKNLIPWIEKVILDNKKTTGDINFVITSDEVLHSINLKYLNTDTYTDIISFTLSEESGSISGDIYISIERVRDNAIKYKVTAEEEFRRILVHGILHLLGYDDKSKGDKTRMTIMENKYLKAFQE